MPEFTPDGELALIRFENATRRSKAPKKARGNQTPANLPTVASPIAEYMADIMNEIPRNKTKNEREKLIIENLFIEILRDDQLKNQLTEVISNVTKNTIGHNKVKISAEPLISRSNKTRISENADDGVFGKRTKSTKKIETITTAPATTTETFRESDFITKVDFKLNQNVDSFRTTSSSFFESQDEDDEDDIKTQKDELPPKKKNKNKQEQVDIETTSKKTTINNDIDDDEDVTVETDESDNETTKPSVETTTTKRKSNNKKKQPIKSNLETLDERGKDELVSFYLCNVSTSLLNLQGVLQRCLLLVESPRCTAML